MPKTLRLIEDVVAAATTDLYLLYIKGPLSRLSSARAAYERHFQWFKEKGLTIEPVAPQGWLEGDPGIYVVYFNGTDDPRIAEYSGVFEDPEGRSLSPNDYQLRIIPHARSASPAQN